MFWVCLTSLVFVRIVGLHQQPPILQNQITPATLPSWSVPNRNEFRPQWPVMQSAIPQPAPGPVTMQSWISPQRLNKTNKYSGIENNCTVINDCLHTKKPWWQGADTLGNVCVEGSRTEFSRFYHKNTTLFNIAIALNTTIKGVTEFYSATANDANAVYLCGVTDLNATTCVAPLDTILEEMVLCCFRTEKCPALTS